MATKKTRLDYTQAVGRLQAPSLSPQSMSGKDLVKNFRLGLMGKK